MRIIIKPLGLVVLLTAIACFAILSRVFPLHSGSTTATPPATAPSPVAGTAAAPGPVEPLVLEESAWEAYADPGSAIQKSAITVDSPQIKNAMRFEIPEAGPNSWSVGYHNRVTGVFAASSKAHVKFWGRATEKREIVVLTQSTQAPYVTDAQKAVELTPDWKEYSIDLDIAPHPEGVIYLSFQLGKSTATVELGDITLTRE